MVSERQALPVVSAYSLVIDFHVVIDGFLIAQVVVVLHLGVHDAAVGSVILLLLFFLLLPLLALLEELLLGSAVHSL